MSNDNGFVDREGVYVDILGCDREDGQGVREDGIDTAGDQIPEGDERDFDNGCRVLLCS